jgi:hypothetical protein
VNMAAAFASLPCKVLWRLSPREVAIIERLRLGNNTRVRPGVPSSESQV